MISQVEGRRITLTSHAIERYCERLKSLPNPTPHEYVRLASELSQLVSDFGRLTKEEPAWIGVPPEDVGYIRRASIYVIVSSDICIPTEVYGTKLVALTVLTRGSISEARRLRRNQRKSEKRARRSAARANKAWLGERKQRWM